MYNCLPAHLAPRGIVATYDLPGDACTVDAGGGPPVSVPGVEVTVMSPDGTHIGFATSDVLAFPVDGSVGVMDDTAAASRVLWKFDGSGIALAWSSDGKNLAVQASGAGFAAGLYVVNVRSGTRKWLTG
jgi:hypothetical protein